MDWGGWRIIGNLLMIALLTAMLGVVAHLDRQVLLSHGPVIGPEGAADWRVPGEPMYSAFADDKGETVSDAPADPALEAQRTQYHANVPKSILELQQFRRTQSVAIVLASGRKGTVTLIDLNPSVHSWFVLSVDIAGSARATYHLENPNPLGQLVELSAGGADGLSAGLRVKTPDGEQICVPWEGGPSPLESSRKVGVAYYRLCEGRLFVRNRVAGHYTDLERATEFLRDNVWGGEDIVGFVRESVYQDAYRESGDTQTVQDDGGVQGLDGLMPASVSAGFKDRAVVPQTLGISVDGAPGRRMVLGRWYRARSNPGVYVSAMQPQAVGEAIVARDKGAVNGLDGVEGAAFNYFVAFDLAQFNVRYAVGTDHPRLHWSARVPGSSRIAALPGPDGVAGWAPLNTTGMISPSGGPGVTASFTGGFKREHGGFKHGELSKANHGSHYGFIENGVVLSKLQPGLSTLFVTRDGQVQMKTWASGDDAGLSKIRFARQNGVPVVEMAGDGKPIAGPFVNKWGLGNWSGSADAQLRTLRAGACLIESNGKRFLVYGYFSTATPSAMALVFHAYGCSYAMLLDMNALEHTYMAVYARRGDKLEVQHLVQGMANIDRQVNGKLIPRFVGYPDNRDFFYMVRRRTRP